MTTHQTRSLLVGINLNTAVQDISQTLRCAQLADGSGLDFISMSDHPYNPTVVDTWTTLAYLGAFTQRVRLLPNVVTLPLRPPAMLAKAAATLDRLTGGRVELGLGAGGFWDGIVAYGGPNRSPGEAVVALDEAIDVVRWLWRDDAPAEGIRFSGQHYRLVLRPRTRSRSGLAPRDRACCGSSARVLTGGSLPAHIFHRPRCPTGKA